MQSIWFKAYTPADLHGFFPNTLFATLGMGLTEIGPDYLRGTMPVDHRTHQPQGLLHGGASVALAETLGSIAANLVVDPDLYLCVGQEVNANHVRAIKSGIVTGTARAHYIGRSSHVWGIEIRDDQDRLICIARITMAVKDRR